MKIKNCKQIIVSIIASMALAGMASAQTIIYQDTLTGSGALAGTAPDTVDTHSNVWQLPSIGYDRSGSGAYSTGPYDNLFLPVNGASGVTLDGRKNFTLSALVNNTGSTTMGIDLAYSPYSGGGAFDGGGDASVFLAQMGLLSYYYGSVTDYNGSTSVGFHANLNSNNALLPISGTLALVYNATAETIDYNYNGTTFDTLPGVTPADIQALNYIGITNGAYADNSGTFSNFELQVAGGSPPAAPEPSTYALMLAGFGMLVVFARRRQLV